MLKEGELETVLSQLIPEGNKSRVGIWTRDVRGRKCVHAALDSRLSQSLTSKTTIAKLRSHVAAVRHPKEHSCNRRFRH